MTEKLIDCPRCGSNACSEITHEQGKIWMCMGCGFTTNQFLTNEYGTITEYKGMLPELHQDLEFIDKEGKHWYPTTVTMDDKAMVFAEGTSTENWKWAAVKSKKTPKTLKDGSVVEIDAADMTTKKEFDERDFIEALDYVGYFNIKK